MSASSACAFSDTDYILPRPERRRPSGAEAFTEGRLVTQTRASENAEFSERAVQTQKAMWLSQLHKELRSLRELARGWDGYAGVPLSLAIADFAAKLLESIYCEGAPIPSLVPGSDGSLQIEWHCHGYDIEIDIQSPYDVECSRSAAPAGTEQEEVLHLEDFKDLRAWVQDLSNGEERENPAGASSGSRHGRLCRTSEQTDEFGRQSLWAWSDRIED